MVFPNKMMKLLLLITVLINLNSTIRGLSSFSRNDPYPVFTTLAPHTFLYTREKLRIMGYEVEREEPERIGLSISPFGQNADRGKSFLDIKFTSDSCPTVDCCQVKAIHLGK